MTNDFSRRDFRATPPDRRLSREHELGVVLNWIDIAVSNRPRSLKRLIFLEGEAGVGKTWLLDLIQSELDRRHRHDWHISTIHNARDFIIEPAYRKLIEVMEWCAGAVLPPPSGPSALSIDPYGIFHRSSLLDNLLITRDGQPLILFIDELEWWVDVDGVEAERKEHTLRLLIHVLLKRSDMPCILICAGRKLPALNHYALTRSLERIPVPPFAPSELKKLAVEYTQSNLDDILELAQGNPLVAQLFAYYLAHGSQPGQVTRSIFATIVDKRLSDRLIEILLQLAQKPDGFADNDPLLLDDSDPPRTEKGPAVVQKLTQAAFVSFDVARQRYYVLPPLAGLVQEREP